MLRFLTLAVTVMVLAACGGNDGDGANRSSVTSTPSGTAAVAASTNAPDEATEVSTEAAAEPTATTAEVAATATVAAPTATATEAATATPALPTATSTPEAGKPDVVVGKWTLQTTTIGSFYLLGDVINQGDGDAVSVSVVLTMKDASGAILASSETYVDGIVRAGGKGVWKTIVSDVDPAQIATTDIIVQWTGFDDSFMATLYTDTFVTANVQWTADRIVGEVTNTGDAPAQFVRINAIGYDAAGEVTSVEFTFAQLDRLEPGATSPFEISLFTSPPIPATYDLTVSANIAD